MLKLKAIEIWDNYVSGNMTQFNDAIKGLTSTELIDFVYFVVDEGGLKHTVKDVLSIVYRALTR